MYSRIFLFFTAFLLFAFYSCDNKKSKTPTEQIFEFRSHLTYNDTLQMLQICDNAMELLKQRNIDEVIASLNEYDPETKQVLPLSEASIKSYRRTFNMFPVLEYERVYFSFLLEGCNDVKYSVTFRTPDESGTNESAKTAFMFNPVKVNDTWKLCVKTSNDKIETTLRR